MGAASLAGVIADAKDELITRWRNAVQGTVEPASAGTAEILDSLPGFLDEMVARLEAGERQASDESSAKARAIGVSHGTERFRAGFSLGTIIREYGVLGDCLLDLIRERQIPIDIDQIKIMFSVLTAGVVSAAEQFARERDQVIERQGRKHFAFIAHELRNPLASALLSAQALQHRVGGEDVTLGRLTRNLAVLNRLIDSSLVNARAREAREAQELELAEVSLGQVVAAASAEMGADVDAKRLTLVTEGDARILGDERLIRSAIMNLMQNAARYTHEGGRIEVRIRADEELASVEVEDECGGLPPGTTEELFTPFVQRGPNRAGFGLGLAIVKDTVQAHQGTVQVSNHPGKGCAFMLTFPTRGPAGSAS